MQTKKRLITYRQAINEALVQEMERDKRVFVYGLDVADHKRIFGTTNHLVEKFGVQRCFSTPLSEDAMTGFALGAAISGLRPVHVHIRVDFLLLAVNQLFNMLSNFHYITGGKFNVPVVIRAIIGRGWGQGAQHSKSLFSVFAHIPGLKVVAPTSPQDVKGLTLSAIRDNNPVIIFEHRWLYDIEGDVSVNPEQTVEIGEPNILLEGKEVTVIASSWMNIEALKAAQILKKHNINLEVIDVRTIYPLNYTKIYRSVKKTGRVIVADYDWLYCGFSAEVAARIQENCFESLKSPVTRLGFADTPCPTTRVLENYFYPNAEDIIKAVLEKLKLKQINLKNEEFFSYENKFKGPF